MGRKNPCYRAKSNQCTLGEIKNESLDPNSLIWFTINFSLNHFKKIIHKFVSISQFNSHNRKYCPILAFIHGYLDKRVKIVYNRVILLIIHIICQKHYMF
ncbi:MAG: hypothetical protein UT86_C0005G0005 [Candidatus Magasanikbacteria bacterium GW2011_GWC2_40_17]|uniref:Uncharacterized protein n=1 Tax=Candidatus Magasanikbacteria bacterium GW2011_GWA2_42_32 TaxID=1619039 RepID=A0A0G1CDG9_9BACT|nr:MAG: hypothetical protein UT86_C0005G0005 [Candidatus Magasanikbacteria bacterium GW2011_GWC2_40_17]KKS56741.1 MAG: hypothetical protein UV20_C0006G0024 [Candidatus Magasanikbacteria bacterium GW2011_GWA2_42_32]